MALRILLNIGGRREAFACASTNFACGLVAKLSASSRSCFLRTRPCTRHVHREGRRGEHDDDIGGETSEPSNIRDSKHVLEVLRTLCEYFAFYKISDEGRATNEE
jgi:hypothetical protein